MQGHGAAPVCVNRRGWLIAGLVLLGLAVFGAWLEKPKAAIPHTDTLAITACEGYVRAQLKAPSTAKFSGWGDSATEQRPDGATVVVGYVDSQNSFSAQIRNNWVCVVRASGSTYSLESLQLIPR